METLTTFIDKAIPVFQEAGIEDFILPDEDKLKTLKDYVSQFDEYDVGYFYIHPDGNKGIEMSFTNNVSDLELIVNEKRSPYIFIREGKNFRIVEDVSKENFSKWFHKYLNNSLFQGN